MVSEKKASHIFFFFITLKICKENLSTVSLWTLGLRRRRVWRPSLALWCIKRDLSPYCWHVEEAFISCEEWRISGANTCRTSKKFVVFYYRCLKCTFLPPELTAPYTDNCHIIVFLSSNKGRENNLEQHLLSKLELNHIMWFTVNNRRVGILTHGQDCSQYDLDFLAMNCKLIQWYSAM